MLWATRENVRWRWIFLALLAVLGASYFWYSRRQFPHGGSVLGITYGVVGLLLILLLLFFGVRKRWYRSTWGTLEQWLHSHLYLGLLVVVVILFHSGFRLEDRVAVAAFWVMIAVVVTGLIGALLYHTLPRLLTEVESNLTPEEISQELNQLNRAMARIASGKSPAFQRLYHVLVTQAVPGSWAGWRILLGRTRKGKTGDPADDREGWRQLLPSVAPEEEEDLRQLLVLSRQHQELHQRLLFQQRYKNWLEVWLYLHIPLSVVLLVLVAAHVVAVFYYGF